jgi:hypothetical protein
MMNGMRILSLCIYMRPCMSGCAVAVNGGRLPDPAAQSLGRY